MSERTSRQASSPEHAAESPSRAHRARGLRLVLVNSVILILTMALFVFLIHTTIHMADEYKRSAKAMETYIAWEEAGQSVRRGSDLLTDLVRLFVQTLDRKYADRYFMEVYSTRSRETAVERLAGEHVRAGEHNCIHTGIALSNALTHREIYAIRLAAEAAHLDLATFPEQVRELRLSAADRHLAPEAKAARARELVFDREYREAKLKILNAVSHFMEDVLVRAREAQLQSTEDLGIVLARQRLFLVALSLLAVITFVMGIILVIRPLRIFNRCIREGRPLASVGAQEFRELAGTYNEIFALKEQQDMLLRHKAEHDPLTELLNRSAFDGLRQVLNGEDHPVGLILLDVDHFKEVNDIHGHEVGDAALKRVATLLRTTFRSGDFCIRLGGDEFAVILTDRAPGIRQVIADKIAAINEALSSPEGAVPPLSISVGVAFSRAGFPDSLYGDADSALYRVKEGGRRGCAFFEETGAGADRSAREGRPRHDGSTTDADPAARDA
ncbi:GGDEF domain-containing protein [uncultured Desulfovibrio sp.]|uniref:GGDEF domain-containing protein n=1 Tax=uncultured Desulfovibrio sp. TaxID=167968 RepID=UPI002613B3E2|nr:GGDEF domain-containing protein [uncultured Desulfovibrio sp.]